MFIRYLSTVKDIDSIPPPKEWMNYPKSFFQRAKNGYKTCVMCGQQVRYCGAKKPQDISTRCMRSSDKGVCSDCQEHIWVVSSTKLQIMWCSKCVYFYPLGWFNETKRCARCRASEGCGEGSSGGKEVIDRNEPMQTTNWLVSLILHLHVV